MFWSIKQFTPSEVRGASRWRTLLSVRLLTGFTKEKLSLKMLKHIDPALHPLTREQIKQRVLLAIQTQSVAAKVEFAPSRYRFNLARLTAASAFGVLAIVSTAYAATGSNPGDALYRVKRAQENVQLNLAPSETSKAQLEASFAHERIKELKIVSAKNKTPAAGTKQQTAENSTETVRRDAKNEVKKTLKNLKAAETHLKQQGKVKEALAVRENLKSVKDEAKEQNLIEETMED